MKSVLNLVLGREKNDDDIINQIFTIAIQASYYGVLNWCYLLPRGSYWGGSYRMFARDLYEDEIGEQLPGLNAEEFLQKYRVKRKSLCWLVSWLKHTLCLTLNNRKKRKILLSIT